MNESDELRERAERLKAPVAIKGDAETKRQAKRDLNDSKITIGSYINTYIYGNGIVTKINKKTYTVKCDRGVTGPVDKSYIELIK
jgi:ribosomal protein L31E